MKMRSPQPRRQRRLWQRRRLQKARRPTRHGKARQERKDSLRHGAARNSAHCIDEFVHGKRRGAAGDGFKCRAAGKSAGAARRPRRRRDSANARASRRRQRRAARQADALTPAPPDAAEVADRQTQSAPLGQNGTTTPPRRRKRPPRRLLRKRAWRSRRRIRATPCRSRSRSLRRFRQCRELPRLGRMRQLPHRRSTAATVAFENQQVNGTGLGDAPGPAAF